MLIECPHCAKQFDVVDGDVKAYVGRLEKKTVSESQAAACKANAKKPRPGSIGNTRAKKAKETV